MASQISLQLEPAIGIEGLILNRLSRIPSARRQDWLRGLLTQGFLAECQTLRALQQGAPMETSPSISADYRPANRSSARALATQSCVDRNADTGQLTGADPVIPVSFTALRKLIG
jgi:hypothetical protein